MLHQQYSTTTTTDNDHITLEIIDISIQYDDIKDDIFDLFDSYNDMSHKFLNK